MSQKSRFRTLALLLSGLLCIATAYAGPGSGADAGHASHWPDSWTTPQEPFRIFGNSYYVGVHGLSSVLVTSDQGHILLDGALPESADKIAASIRALGFKLEDVKFILNSHAHFDHAGGIAKLQRLSGATVAASPSAIQAMMQGHVGEDDPQAGNATPYPPVVGTRAVHDGETLTVGPLAVTAHFTPGHTPGGTSWTWKSCEGKRCASIVYADSINPVSVADFKFTDNDNYPNAIRDLEGSFATLSKLPCDILISVHPEFSGMWAKLARTTSEKNGFFVPRACRKYVGVFKESLRKRIAAEHS
ncbi:subclass B3 metallo-beta-lactamase [Undibacterium terreum]|uniref:CAU/MBL1b family subclass B3 metallo-beta-lactamase n=1 Tax=Undibacterium terreum TaxID=1224302 RepID=A0A916XMF8_9BURK|nr:subclass B3 metallo-beta-lactamase [Undibacterium terreum]GGC84199.1 CAU/MBL1b family subclass B3 metallo-beta-lactamase [Undibacterium terreum]